MKTRPWKEAPRPCVGSRRLFDCAGETFRCELRIFRKDVPLSLAAPDLRETEPSLTTAAPGDRGLGAPAGDQIAAHPRASGAYRNIRRTKSRRRNVHSGNPRDRYHATRRARHPE